MSYKTTISLEFSSLSEAAQALAKLSGTTATVTTKVEAPKPDPQPAPAAEAAPAKRAAAPKGESKKAAAPKAPAFDREAVLGEVRVLVNEVMVGKSENEVGENKAYILGLVKELNPGVAKASDLSDAHLAEFLPKLREFARSLQEEPAQIGSDEDSLV